MILVCMLLGIIQAQQRKKYSQIYYAKVLHVLNLMMMKMVISNIQIKKKNFGKHVEKYVHNRSCGNRHNPYL